MASGTAASIQNKRLRMKKELIFGVQPLLSKGTAVGANTDTTGYAVDAKTITLRAKGTAVGSTTNSAGYAVGIKTIVLASAGTGTILSGDVITFAGDTTKYPVVTGDTDVSNGGTIVLATGLNVAIPASPVAITVATAGTILAGDTISFASDANYYEVDTGDTDVSNGGTIVLKTGLKQAIPASSKAITIETVDRAGATEIVFVDGGANFTNKQGIIESNEITKSGVGANFDRDTRRFAGDIKCDLHAGGTDHLLASTLGRDFSNSIDVTVTAATDNDITSLATVKSVNLNIDLTAAGLVAGNTIKFISPTGLNAALDGTLWIVQSIADVATGGLYLRPKGHLKTIQTQANKNLYIQKIDSGGHPVGSVYGSIGNADFLAMTASFTSAADITDFADHFTIGQIIAVNGVLAANRGFFLITVIDTNKLYGFFTNNKVTTVDASGQITDAIFSYSGIIRTEGTSTNTLALTVSGSTYKITSSESSLVNDGFKIGMVFRCFGVGFVTAANKDRNFKIIDMAASGANLTFIPMDNGDAPVAETGIDDNPTGYIQQYGGITYLPQDNRTSDSWSIEELYTDISESILSYGQKVTGFSITTANNGIPQISFTLMGKGANDPSKTQFYTSATFPLTSTNLSTIYSKLFYNGVQIGCITKFDLNVVNGITMSERCYGSDTAQHSFDGKIKVSGTVGLLFTNDEAKLLYLNKKEQSLDLYLGESSEPTADFLSFTMPRVVFTEADNANNMTGCEITMPFIAFENPNGNDDSETPLIMSALRIQSSKA